MRNAHAVGATTAKEARQRLPDFWKRMTCDAFADDIGERLDHWWRRHHDRATGGYNASGFEGQRLL